MMSERNGDRARFQKNRRRKLLNRQRVQALAAAQLAAKPADTVETPTVQPSRARRTKAGP
jgi:hypothetical protein